MLYFKEDLDKLDRSVAYFRKDDEEEFMFYFKKNLDNLIVL